MNKHILSAAIAAASLLGFSQASYAIAPTVTPDIEIWMSGATAQDKGIKALFTNLCGADLDVFLDNGAPNPGRAHSAYYCTLTSAPGFQLTKNGVNVASAKVLFHKRSQGGSAQGVNSLIEGTPIVHMKVLGNPTCVETAAGSKDWRCSFAVPNQDLRISDMGVSDVEPTLFTGPNVPTGTSAVSPAAADAALTVVAGAALIFGVPVSDNLYVALQAADKLLAGFGGTCAPGAYTDACMPSLSRDQVATLLSGKVKRWTEIYAGPSPQVPLPTLVAGLTYTDSDGTVRNVAPVDPKFHYCKRINGSGTGAQQYVKFLNNPCSSAGLNPDWDSVTFPVATAGPIKHEVSGSGDIELCLEDFADGENNANQETLPPPVPGQDTFTTKVNTVGNTGWAIGTQSLENNAGHTKHYRFIKINGVAPTLAKAFTGDYMDWVELTFQVRKNLPNDPVTGFNVDKTTIFNKLATDVSSPTIIGTEGLVFNHPFGKSGYMALGKNYTWGEAVDEARPIMPFSHAETGKLNNCQIPVIPRPTTLNPRKHIFDIL